MFNISQIMKEAHAAARIDMADDRADPSPFNHHPYSYYLGLQMRTAFAKARERATGMVAMSADLARALAASGVQREV